MKNNTWYNDQDNFASKLSENIKEDTKSKELSQEDIARIEKVFSEFQTDFSHRCISVYRDAVNINGKIYDICLSCGDVILDGQIYYLTSVQEDALKELKIKLFS
jgi:type I restriction-modification system DNA methylase subunit